MANRTFFYMVEGRSLKRDEFSFKMAPSRRRPIEQEDFVQMSFRGEYHIHAESYIILESVRASVLNFDLFSKEFVARPMIGINPMGSSQENKRFVDCNCFCFCIDKAGETVLDIDRFVLAKCMRKNRSHKIMSSELVDGSEHIGVYIFV